MSWEDELWRSRVYICERASTCGDLDCKLQNCVSFLPTITTHRQPQLAHQTNDLQSPKCSETCENEIPPLTLITLFIIATTVVICVTIHIHDELGALSQATLVKRLHISLSFSNPSQAPGVSSLDSSEYGSSPARDAIKTPWLVTAPK